MNHENITQLYNFLANNGVQDLGSLDEFTNRMNSRKDRETLYRFMISNGVIDAGGDIDEFEAKLGLRPTKVTEPEPVTVKGITPYDMLQKAEEDNEVEPVQYNPAPLYTNYQAGNAGEVMERNIEGAQERLASARESLKDVAPRGTEGFIDDWNERQQVGKMTTHNPLTQGSASITANIKAENIGIDEYHYLRNKREEAISRLDAILQEAEQLKKDNPERYYTMGGGLQPTITPTSEGVHLNNAIGRLKDTRKHYQKIVTKADKEIGGERNALWKGLGEADILNILTAGWKDTLSNIDIAIILEKANRGEKLTSEENLFLKMLNEEKNLEEIVNMQGGQSRAYGIGSGVAESLPFITGMATTAGVSGAVSGATKKIVGEVAERGFKQFLQKGTSKLLGSATSAALSTPLQSGMWNNYAQNTISEWNRDGKLTSTTWGRLMDGYADAFTDIFTESLGGLLSQSTEYATAGLGVKTYLAKKLGIHDAFMQDVFKTIKWDGVVGEFEEELLANFLSPLVRGDNWKDAKKEWAQNFSKENLWITLGTTALMGGGFGGFQAVQAGSQIANYNEIKKKAQKALEGINDGQLRQQVYDAMQLPTLKDSASALAQINWQAQDTSDIGKATDYVYNTIQKDVYNGIRIAEEGNKAMASVIVGMQAVSRNGKINTAEVDGKPVYLLGDVMSDSPNAPIVVVYMDGSHEQVPMSAISGEVSTISVQDAIADIFADKVAEVQQNEALNTTAEEIADARRAGVVPIQERDSEIEEGDIVSVEGEEVEVVTIDRNTNTARVKTEDGKVKSVPMDAAKVASVETPTTPTEETPAQTSAQNVESAQSSPIEETVKIEPIRDENGKEDYNAMGEERTAAYVVQEMGDRAGEWVDRQIEVRKKAVETAQKGKPLPLDMAEAKKAVTEQKELVDSLNSEIAMWESVKTRLTTPQAEATPTAEVEQTEVVTPAVEEAATTPETPTEVAEEQTAPAVNKQGNPIDKDGRILVEVVESIDDITDEDFERPIRSVQLPELPSNVDDAIGANGKPVIIKKNIFERNAVSHSDLTPEQSRQILKSALYSPKLYGQNQKKRKPYNWVVISVQDESAPNKLVLLEVNEGKDSVEIVHWHYIDQRGLEKLKRQAEREDGQLLILPSVTSEEVGALADPTLNQPSENKDTTSIPKNNAEEQKNITEEKENAPETPATPEWSAGLLRDENAENFKDADAWDAIGKSLGVQIVITDDIKEDGLYDPQRRVIKIANKERSKGINTIVGHEFLHRMRDISPEMYEKFKAAVKEYVGEEVFNARKEFLNELYRIAVASGRVSAMPSDSVIEEEICADFAGWLTGKYDIFQRFVERHKTDNVFLKAIKSALAHIRTFFKGGNSGISKDLKKCVDMLDQLMDASAVENQTSEQISKDKATENDEFSTAHTEQGYIERLPNKTKYNIWGFTADKSSRPIRTTPTIFEGVFYDNGFRVASDGQVLVKEKASYPAEYEGTARMRDGSRTDEGVKYPKYKVIIDNLKGNKAKDMDFDDFLGFLNAIEERVTSAHKEAEDRRRSLKSALNYTPIAIKLPTGDIWYGSLAKLQKFALAAKQIGADKVYYKDASTMLSAKNNKGEVVLVMPVRADLYPYVGSVRYYYEPTLEAKPQVEQSSPSINKRTPEGLATSTDKAIIEDVGEEIKGARKNALKEFAEKLNNVTIENLIVLPLSKVFKPTDYTKMVQKGMLSKEDALFLEAITMLITQSSKPKLTKRYDSKKNLENWATRQYVLISMIKEYCNADENVKPNIKERILAKPDYTRELEMVEQRKKWNPHLAEKYGNTYNPNPIKVMLDVLRALGYPSAKVGKIDIPTIVANGFNNGYEAQSMSGKRIYSINGDVDYNTILNDVVRYCKIQLGHTDITYDMGKDIRVIGLGNPLFKETGKYIVYYFKNSKSTIVSEQLFDSKEEADKFAEGYKSARVKPQTERNGYNEYGFCIIDVVSGERFPLDLPKFPTLEDAKAYMQDNAAEINDKANAVVSNYHTKGKGISDTSLPLNVGLSYKPADGTKSYVVYLNSQGERIPIREGFATIQEAYGWLEDNRSKIEDEFAKQKKQQAEFVFFEGEKPRVGKDYRQGKDVTAEDFRDTFGFRGVQFGNWTNQKDRQNAINEAYDALMDMSEILGISPKAVSLNGELGISFGARGGGRYNAHYELDNIVINLTKTRGAGSLAHEWWHALDNYFARQGGVSMGMATEVKGINIRPEVKDAFRDVVNAVSGTAYDKRSKTRGQYWGSIIEETARLFGEWIVYEAEKKGITNSFLSRGVDANKFEVWQRHNYEVYKKISGEDITFEEYANKYDSLAGMPYPNRAETEAMSAPIRALFDTIEERETEDGNVALFSLREVNDRFNEQLATLTEENKDRVILSLGMPSNILRAAGVVNKPMKLYGSKLFAKAKKHGYNLKDIEDLPLKVSTPIAVFKGSRNESHAILTEIKIGNHNVLATLSIGKGGNDVDFNIVSSVYGKLGENVIKWIEEGKLEYIDKEKALNYLHHSAPIAEALSNSRQVSETNLSAPIAEALLQEINLATNIVQNFENPSIEPRFSLRNTDTFYSNAEFAVQNIKQEKATPEQWLKMIEKNGGLKAGEDKWLGLSDWLKESKAKTLTKDEVLDYINANKIQIEEVEYGDLENTARFKELQEEYRQLYYDYDHNSDRAMEEMIDRYGDDFSLAFSGEGDKLEINDYYGSEDAEVFIGGKSINETRHQYTTDGLENKREIAFVVPTIAPYKQDDEVHFGDAGNGRAVAWVRFGDAVNEYGERVLVIDEIQSKRHQDAREKGYISNDVFEAEKQLNELYSKIYTSGVTEEEHNRMQALREFLEENKGEVPEAPFEKNWHEVAMKRILRYAAENGYDMVAWTTGVQQAERYDIGKQVDEIRVFDAFGGEHEVVGYKDGKMIFSRQTQNGEQGLVELLGKDMARKAYSNLHEGKTDYTDENDIVSFKGEDLVVGGTGMRAFYDQILPSFMNRYGKKWGVKVGEVTMPWLEENNTMHAIDVTDAMRESVMQGQPLFSLRYTPEEQEIIERAKANGTYLLAPNGKPTNLTPKQWVQVRTKAFKMWFGDWEKDARIEKLRKSDNIVISGKEITASDNLKEYRKSALEYGKTIRGEYVNSDTGNTIIINKDSITEVLHHDGSNIAHIQSIAAIPQMVESGIYIASEPISEPTSKRLRNATMAHYYVCGLEIGGTPYTVKFVVAEFESGEKYYDHSLTEIEKGELLNRAELSSTVAESNTPISDIKDKRLVSILQTNSSKVVDANGEPKVVYNGSKVQHYNYDGRLRTKGQSATNSKVSFFTDNKAVAERYGKFVNEVFLNIRNPYEVDYNGAGWQGWSGAADGMQRASTDSYADLLANGSVDSTLERIIENYGRAEADHLASGKVRKEGVAPDGVIAYEVADPMRSTLYIVRNAEAKDISRNSVTPKGVETFTKRGKASLLFDSQIKSATDNLGSFSKDNDDIRFALRLPEYQNRFTQLTEEYSALDKSNPEAVADFRARKRNLVEEYWGDFASALGADVETMVVDSTNNPEALRPVYDIVKNRLDTDETFEKFVKDYNKRENGSAFHIPNTHIIVVDMVKIDKRNTQKEVSQIFLHENVHRIIEDNIPKRDLVRVWNECAGKDFGKLLRKGYPDDGSATLGDEMLAYSIAGLEKTDISPLLDFIEGVDGVPVEDIMAMYKKTLPLRNEIASKILTIIKDEYSREREFVDTMDEETLSGLWGGYSGNYEGRDHGRRYGGYSAGDTYIEDGRRVTVIDEDFSIVEDLPEFDESPRYSLRVTTEQMLADELNYNALSGAAKASRGLLKAIQDNMIDIKKLQEQLQKNGVEIRDDNNFYNAMDVVGSKAEYKYNKYLEVYINPLLDFMGSLERDYGASYDEISDYMLAKHSIERHDSGLNALNPDDDAPWGRNNVEKIVRDFESKVPADKVDELWRLINSINDKNLDILVQGGIKTTDDVQNIKSRGWKFYVPLKEWDLDANNFINPAEYYDVETSARNGNYTKGKWMENGAKGRTSKPYAALPHMLYAGNKAIIFVEQNRAMQALYSLLMDANDALGAKVANAWTISEHYYVRDAIGVWEEKKASEIPASDLSMARAEMRDIAKLTREQRRAYINATKLDKSGRSADALLERQRGDAIGVEIKRRKAAQTITVNNPQANHPNERMVGKPQFDAKMQVSFYVNGQQITIDFTNRRYASAINKVSEVQFRSNNSVLNNILRSIKWGTRAKSQLSTTYNPNFLTTNLYRDTLFSAYNHAVDKDHGHFFTYSKYRFANSPIFSSVIRRGLNGSAQPLTATEMKGKNLLNKSDRAFLVSKYGKERVNDTLFQWFCENGAPMGFSFLKTTERTEKEIRKNLRRMRGKTNRWQAFLNNFPAFAEWFSRMSQNMELVNRYATFLTSLQHGESVGQAVANSRDFTLNFNRKGDITPVANSLWAFFNPTVQGIARFASVSAKNPTRSIPILTGIALLGYQMAMMLSNWWDDEDGDDDYMTTTKVPRWMKRDYLVIPISQKDGGMIRIPLPQQVRTFYAIGSLLYDLHAGEINSEEFAKEMFDTIKADFTYGFTEGGEWWRSIVPTVGQPLVDLATNQDAFGRKIYREGGELTPDSELGMKNVNEFWDNFAKGLNELTGGGKYDKGVIDINPSKLQYLAEQTFGGTGTFARRLVELVESFNPDGRVAFELHNIPVIGSLLYTTTPESGYDEYYNWKMEYGREATSIMNRKLKDGVVSQKEYNDFKSRKSVFNALNKTVNAVEDLRNNYEYGSEEYDAINFELRRQRNLLNKVMEEMNWSVDDVGYYLDHLVEKYDPNRLERLTKLNTEYAKEN